MVKTEGKKPDLTESFVSVTLGFLVVIVAALLLYNYFSKSKSVSPTQEEAKDTWEEKTINLPTTHTVTSGENLWSIALKYYDSGYNWVSIAKENNLSNPDNIQAGITLTIPKTEVITPKRDDISAASIEPEKTYIVIKGDSLWKIAIKEYGSGYEWVKIAKANNLINPNLIHAGNVLKLPR